MEPNCNTATAGIPGKSKGVGVQIPGALVEEAKNFLELSGFVSISDLVRSKIRLWSQGCKSLNLQISEADKQRKNTLRSLLPIWVGNFRDNLPEIHESPDIKDLKKQKKGSFVVVGAGPSIKKLSHISMIGLRHYKGTVIATDKILRHCIEEGVVPDYVVFLDCDPCIKEWIDNKTVKEQMDKIKAVMATTVDPEVVKNWKGEKYFFNAQIDYVPDDLSVSNFMQIMTSTNSPYATEETADKAKFGKSIMNTSGGNVGSCSWSLACYLMGDYSKENLKKYPIGLIGMDLGWPIETPLEETDYFGPYYKMCGGDMEKIKENYVEHYNPFFKNRHISCRIFDLYRKTFTTWVEGVKVQDGVQTINCTGGGGLFSDLIPQMHFEDFLKKYKE